MTAIWTGTLPVAEATWLAGDRGPLAGTTCRGGICCDSTGRIAVDDIAVEWLSRLRPDDDGACRRTGDAVEIQAGGAWYRLTVAAPRP